MSRLGTHSRPSRNAVKPLESKGAVHSGLSLEQSRRFVQTAPAGVAVGYANSAWPLGPASLPKEYIKNPNPSLSTQANRRLPLIITGARDQGAPPGSARRQRHQAPVSPYPSRCHPGAPPASLQDGCDGWLPVLTF